MLRVVPPLRRASRYMGCPLLHIMRACWRRCGRSRRRHRAATALAIHRRCARPKAGLLKLAGCPLGGTPPYIGGYRLLLQLWRLVLWGPPRSSAQAAGAELSAHLLLAVCCAAIAAAVLIPLSAIPLPAALLAPRVLCTLARLPAVAAAQAAQARPLALRPPAPWLRPIPPPGVHLPVGRLRVP
jgi:hypothetical protein